MKTVPRFVEEYKNHVLMRVQEAIALNDDMQKNLCKRAENAVLYADKGLLTVDEAMEVLVNIVAEVRMIW